MGSRYKQFDGTFGGAVDAALLRNFFRVFYPYYPGQPWHDIVTSYRSDYGVEQARAVAHEIKKVLQLTRGQEQVSEALLEYGCGYLPFGDIRKWLVKFERKLKRRASPN